ncbi:MAG TPA: hypothetical protein VL475_00565, partial [Planctomycetaceae bacterium]|nr:hypothetical protein [Planctomycetaceae bacterium]
QNRRVPNNMTTFTRLTFAVTLLSLGGWALSAPPRRPANRPVVIGTPILEPDDEPAAAEEGADARALAAGQPEPSTSAATEKATDSAGTAAGELKRARERLLKFGSIQAKIVETVAIVDRSYKAEGSYLQTGLKPNDWHMRLELSLKVGDSEGALLEVCDGDVLWTSTQIEAGRKASQKGKKDQSLVRRNVTEILSAARKRGDQSEARLIAELGLGGLPGILAAMEQDMQFSGMKNDTLRDRPVVIIQGTWTEAFAARFQNPQQRGASALLPAFVPDSVWVYIDRESGFPHRIMYRKKLPNRDAQRAMLTFDFLDVALNQPIDNSEFAYEPPTGITPVELTEYYLKRLSAAGDKP